MHTADFDFTLPQELIAQAPLPQRDASRLLHVRRDSGAVTHRAFVDLPSLLRRGDVLVFNDTRVIPARLLGHKVGTGGRAELLLMRPAAEVDTAEALAAGASGTVWACLGQSSKGFRPGMRLTFGGGLEAEVLSSEGGGEYRVRFTSSLATLEDALRQAGRLPLPPYITREPERSDDERYQTVYAARSGSVAAPTAGLHFTPELLARLDALGVERRFVTLEVGPGTFMPVREGDLSSHVMHPEKAHLSAEVAARLALARAEQRRIIAVGTTVVRTLESLRGKPGTVDTRLFITPGYAFSMVDALITNFHLPKSTLVMLVSAFLGREKTLGAYAEAIRERYRFFSYGDAMFVD